MIEWPEFAKWAFLGLVGSVLSYGVYILHGMHDTMVELNTKLAVILSRVDTHEKRLDRLEDSQK